MFIKSICFKFYIFFVQNQIYHSLSSSFLYRSIVHFITFHSSLVLMFGPYIRRRTVGEIFDFEQKNIWFEANTFYTTLRNTLYIMYYISISWSHSKVFCLYRTFNSPGVSALFWGRRGLSITGVSPTYEVQQGEGRLWEQGRSPRTGPDGSCW